MQFVCHCCHHSTRPRFHQRRPVIIVKTLVLGPTDKKRGLELEGSAQPPTTAPAFGQIRSGRFTLLLSGTSPNRTNKRHSNLQAWDEGLRDTLYTHKRR